MKEQIQIDGKIDGNNQKTSMNFFNKSEAILDINDIIIKI